MLLRIISNTSLDEAGAKKQGISSTRGGIGERGNPAARIRKREVVAAFGKKRPAK